MSWSRREKNYLVYAYTFCGFEYGRIGVTYMECENGSDGKNEFQAAVDIAISLAMSGEYPGYRITDAAVLKESDFYNLCLSEGPNIMHQSQFERIKELGINKRGNTELGC